MMDSLTSQHEFSTAIQHYQAGERRAEICRRILRYDPQRVRRLNGVSLRAIFAGALECARPHLRQFFYTFVFICSHCAWPISLMRSLGHCSN